MGQIILLIEDDNGITMGIRSYLQQQQFTVDAVATVAQAKAYLSKMLPSLIILDWNLPDGTGDELCIWIREKWLNIPIIFLTVRGDTADMLKGFQTGADDYIVKPFDLEILYSRIIAVLRRTGTTSTNILICGPVTVDKSSMRVFCNKSEITLSSMEYQLLVMLIENKNRTLTRERILEAVWDSNGNFVNDNTLTVAMKRLREKLHNPSCIKTLRSLGYRMEDGDEK